MSLFVRVSFDGKGKIAPASSKVKKGHWAMTIKSANLDFAEIIRSATDRNFVG